MSTLLMPANVPTLSGLPLDEAFIVRAAAQVSSFDFDCGTGGHPEYLVTDHIADGGMASVYKAVSPSGEVVAVKFLSQGAPRPTIERFSREAETLKELRHHPGIAQIRAYAGQSVAVTAAGRVLPNDNPYIAMEFLEGKPLDRVLEEENLTIEEIADLLLQVCDAVNHAHSLGIIHRDIKPENIFICPPAEGRTRRRVKMLDFGVAKDLQGNDGLTPSNVVLGTPHFMSPEQCKGIGVMSKSDVYSIGVMAFLMIEKCYPFQNHADLMELIAWQVQGERPTRMERLDGLSEQAGREGKHSYSLALKSLEGFILRAMSRDQRNRPILNELTECLSKVVQAAQRNRRKTPLICVVEATTATFTAAPPVEEPTPVGPAALAAAAVPDSFVIGSAAGTIKHGVVPVKEFHVGTMVTVPASRVDIAADATIPDRAPGLDAQTTARIARHPNAPEWIEDGPNVIDIREDTSYAALRLMHLRRRRI